MCLLRDGEGWSEPVIRNQIPVNDQVVPRGIVHMNTVHHCTRSYHTSVVCSSVNFLSKSECRKTNLTFLDSRFNVLTLRRRMTGSLSRIAQFSIDLVFLSSFFFLYNMNEWIEFIVYNAKFNEPFFYRSVFFCDFV